MQTDLHPDQIAAAYEFVRTLHPFSGWAKSEGGIDFPHADEIEFHIVGDRSLCAFKKRKDDGSYIIGYSDKGPRHPGHIIMYTAHEMIHVYQDLNKLENRSMHNADFMFRAQEVCDIHGYDLRLFV